MNIDNLLEKGTQKKMPGWTSPMLAKLTHEHFESQDWLYERKLDGERCLVFCRDQEIHLMSRNRKKINTNYPELVESLQKKVDKELILDGEVVAFEGETTSFSRLQERMHVQDPQKAKESNVAVYLYCFDILYFDGFDVTKLKLLDRKSILNEVISFKDPLRLTEYRRNNGLDYYKDACKKGWEGLIVKKIDSTYKHSRSGDWLKFKCVNQQEFVIGGYTDPEGERIGFGALLVGYFDRDNKFRYAGKIGTGYDDKTLERLKKKLSSRERQTNPFEKKINETGIHWVTPDMVIQAGFTEWTEEGKLRHPRYLGERRDKEAKEVVKEEPDHE